MCIILSRKINKLHIIAPNKGQAQFCEQQENEKEEKTAHETCFNNKS